MTKQCLVCGKILYVYNMSGFCKTHNSRRLRSLKGQNPEERIERLCLKCDRPFTAKGKYNRICKRCTEINNAIVRGAMTSKSVTKKAPSGFKKSLAKDGYYENYLNYVDLS